MRPWARNLEVPNFAVLIHLMFVTSALGIASDAFNLFPGDSDKVEPLLCDVHCYCTLGREDRIICNQTTAQIHKLTAQVFDNLHTSRRLVNSYVNVQAANQVLVTEGFLLKWEEYTSSALDFWNIGTLVFEPRTNITKKKSKLKFGGVGIVNSTVRDLPEGLINNKEAASLLFYNTTIDHIPSHTLMGVQKLRYLVIDKSRVGLLEGSAVSEPLILERRPRKIKDFVLSNSTFGIIETNAIQITGGQRKYGKSEQFILSNSRIGLMERNAIQLKGQLDIQVTETWVLNMEAESLKINTGPVNIVNNTFVGQPGLLVDLPCGDSTVVEGNLVIPMESPDKILGTQMNKHADFPVDASVSTKQSIDLSKASDIIKPSYATESSASTTKILMSSTPLQRPATASPPPPPTEVGHRFFHPLCKHNFVISRDNIVMEEVVVTGNPKFLVFFLLACCILLLILLLFMTLCCSIKKRKNKVKPNEDSIYEEPTVHWSARPPALPLYPAPAPVSNHPGLLSLPVVTVSDEQSPEYVNTCLSTPNLCYANTLGRPQACRTQQSHTAPVGNDYCTMRSPASKLGKGNDVSHSTLP